MGPLARLLQVLQSLVSDSNIIELHIVTMPFEVDMLSYQSRSADKTLQLDAKSSSTRPIVVLRKSTETSKEIHGHLYPGNIVYAGVINIEPKYNITRIFETNGHYYKLSTEN